MCLKKSPKILKGNSNLEVGTKDKESQTEKQYHIKHNIMFMWAQTRRWGCAKTEIGNESLFSSLVTTIFENDQTEHIIHDWQINF